MRGISSLLMLLFTIGQSFAASVDPRPDLAATLKAAAEENRSSLRAYAAHGCAGSTSAHRPRLLEVKFLGGQTARLLVVDVVRHAESIEVSFYTPGTAVLATRTVKLRPGTAPRWLTAEGKAFPIDETLIPVTLHSSEFAGVRGPTESPSCYVARLASNYVRPPKFAEVTENDGANADH